MIAAFTGVLLLAAIFASAAYASTENISGDLNRDGSLVQYSTFRTHTYTGVISVNLNNNTVNYTRLGLRNTAGSQFTNTERWDSLGLKNFHLSSNGSTTIAQGTRFAFNGRMGSTVWPADNHWGGVLTY
jgi:hypothetical protein